MNKLLSDRLTRQSFIIKSIDCSQEGDIIIHGLKRKMGGKRRHDAITASDNKSQNKGRALGLNQRALDICFDACEAHLSRLTVIIFL